jgi:hypothetical protein
MEPVAGHTRTIASFILYRTDMIPRYVNVDTCVSLLAKLYDYTVFVNAP